MPQRFLRLLGLVFLVGSLGCGGGSKPTVNGGTSGTISGVVAQAVVSAATVSAYRLEAGMTRGAVIASTTTSDGLSGSGGRPAGTYQLNVGGYNGPLEVVATGGSYYDEATGVLTNASGYEISAGVGMYQAGTNVTVTVSPVSSIATAVARHDVMANSTPIGQALDTAYMHVNAHFGVLDWRTIVPADLASATNWTDAVAAAVILAGLSQEASAINTLINGTPGVTITAAILSYYLAQDALTGILDGLGPSGQITLGTLTATWQPNGQTLRYFLGQSMLAYLQAHSSLASLTANVNTLASAIAADSDPYLFNSPGLNLGVAPPAVALVSPGAGAGPYYTNQTSMAGSAQVTGLGNGVAAVYVLAQASAAPIAATLCDASTTPACSSPLWQFTVPLANGTNLVKLYAVDNAGQGAASNCVAAGTSASANCITFSMVRDASQPALMATAGGTYYDETNMTVGPDVPPVYTFPDPTSAACTAATPALGCVPSTVTSSQPIHKAATRLAPQATTDASVLEGANPDNLPWLQFSASPSGAPLVTASYQIKATAGGTTTTYTGNLLPWVSPTSNLAATAGTILFDLPLDIVRIALLATTPGTVSLAVTISATDAAGNSASLQNAVSLTYAIIGPPLFIAQDPYYPWALDLQSTFAYFIADATYPYLWLDSQRFQNGQVRLVRYLVRNPTPYYVALNPGFLATSPTPTSDGWSLTEYHARRLDPYDPYPGSCDSYNNCTIDYCYLGGWVYSGVVSVTSALTGLTTSCDTTKNVCGHRVGSFTCIEPLAPTTWTDSPGPSAVSLIAYQNPLDTGGETVPADQIAGLIRVPPAAGSTPGSLAFYLSRPFALRSVELTSEELFYGNCATYCTLYHAYTTFTGATDYLTQG